MMIRKLLRIIILLLFAINSSGQTTYLSVCSIYKVKSANGKFFLRSIPFDEILQSQDGITKVFTSDSNLIYTIPRYFELSDNQKELFLSIDGQTLAYIVDREYDWRDVSQKTIEIYRNGKLLNAYQLNQLINCDNNVEDCYLLYKEAIESVKWDNGQKETSFKENATNIERRLCKRAIYYTNDTLTIFCKGLKVLNLSLQSGIVNSQDYSEFESIGAMQQDTFNFESLKFNKPSIYGLPELVSGDEVAKSLAEFLDMHVYPEESKKSFKYKSYRLNLEIIIDSNGNGEIGRVDSFGGLPKNEILNFINQSKFQKNYIPQGIEKWRFDEWIALMNKSKKIAKNEKRQEQIESRKDYEMRLVADSIDGLYIPKNLEECFIELNKLLKQKDIDEIKSLNSKDETIKYHLGLGLWLRNNWGLWGGSRLQQYFLNKGIDHPDSMSSLILEYYYDWLNNENDDWRKFESK